VAIASEDCDLDPVFAHRVERFSRNRISQHRSAATIPRVHSFEVPATLKHCGGAAVGAASIAVRRHREITNAVAASYTLALRRRLVGALSLGSLGHCREKQDARNNRHQFHD
jgi:hypothetical protein